MGLDTFAALTPHGHSLTDDDMEAVEAVAPGAENLDRVQGSFLGKHYVELVQQITGISLDQPWIPPEVVPKMAADFRTYAGFMATSTTTSETDHYVGELQAFLQVCANRGLALVPHSDDNGRAFAVSAARTPNPWGLTDDDVAAFNAAAPDLCGGMYSGGDGSFRGKVYVELVRMVTGVSLNQEWIPPETVRFMADAFEDTDPEQTTARFEEERRYGDCSPEDIRQLGAFFRVCADRGLGLVGWF